MLAPGWYAETVTDVATSGASTSETPTQEELREVAGDRIWPGQLPTQEMLSGDPETQEDIEAVYDLLGGFGEDEADAFDFGGDDNGGLL